MKEQSTRQWIGLALPLWSRHLGRLQDNVATIFFGALGELSAPFLLGFGKEQQWGRSGSLLWNGFEQRQSNVSNLQTCDQLHAWLYMLTLVALGR
jgi:hypothetical protein